ncbi:hypothetical protein HMPREF0554_2399, partial [Pseudoleptotrichia goodfellowii F0264]
GKVEGRQRKVPEGSEEKGLESTGRATNDFFKRRIRREIYRYRQSQMEKITAKLILVSMWGMKEELVAKTEEH